MDYDDYDYYAYNYVDTNDDIDNDDDEHYYFHLWPPTKSYTIFTISIFIYSISSIIRYLFTSCDDGDDDLYYFYHLCWYKPSVACIY